MPVKTKYGTTTVRETRAAWFVGFTPELGGFFSKLATTLPRELLAEHQRLVHDLAAARGRAEARCP